MNIIIQDKDITLFLNLLSEEFDIHINGIYWNKDFEFSWRNLFGTCKTFFGDLLSILHGKKNICFGNMAHVTTVAAKTL